MHVYHIDGSKSYPHHQHPAHVASWQVAYVSYSNRFCFGNTRTNLMPGGQTPDPLNKYGSNWTNGKRPLVCSVTGAEGCTETALEKLNVSSGFSIGHLEDQMKFRQTLPPNWRNNNSNHPTQ